MTVIDSTWNWRQLAPGTPPTRRTYPAMAWIGDRVLMFGGNTDTPSPQALDDTWELVGDEWDQLTPVTTPSTRSGARMIYDGARAVMMCGTSFSLTPRLDAWEYVAGDWNDLGISQGFAGAPAFQGQGYGHEFVWVGSRGLALVPKSGGSRVYEFTADDFTLLTLATEYGAVVADVPAREFVAGVWTGSEFVVCGGRDIGNTSSRNDVVALAGTAWGVTVAAGTPGSFGKRDSHRAVWTGDQMFFFDGQFSPNGSGPSAIEHSQYLYDPVTDAVAALVTTDVPPQRTAYDMVWDGERVILFGGQDGIGGSLLDDTWVLEPPPPPIAINATFGLP